MSWYKKAKLIDKEYGTGKPSMPVQCAWCKRWSTHPVNPLAPKEESIWKNPEELDEEEKIEVQKAIREDNTSHSVCPPCLEIALEEIPSEKRREFSL